MLHKINFPVACRPYFDWIVTLQRRLLAGLCQNSIENPDVVDETWLLAVLGDLPVDRDWFSRFCNWKHEGQTLLERARCITGFATENKVRLLADFENDHTFEMLFDPEAKDAHDLAGLAPLQALDPQAAKVVHRFFESFYDPVFYTKYGYKIPLNGAFNKFDRQVFVDKFADANPDVCVCPMCDGYRGTAKVDHFFPKAAYPYLSCHPLNLVPVCDGCNGPGGKHESLPLSLAATSYQTDDWFHPYLRPAHDAYTIGFERQGEDIELLISGEDERHQTRLDNMSSLLKLGERWNQALSLRIRIAHRSIDRVCRDLGRSLTETELCNKLKEWARSAEDEIGLESFAIIKAAYFRRASQKEPMLFDDLWVYNAPGVDVVTVNEG